MKFKILFLISIMMTFLSCSSDEDRNYSCDKEVDTWVKDHLSEIHSMNRSDWLNVSDRTKLAVFRAFTREQKIEFWNNKLNQTLELDWSEEERGHIREVIVFINSHPIYFDSKELTEDYDNELELFFYEWTNRAINKFNWDKQVVYAIVCTGLPLKDKAGVIDINTSLADRVEKLTSSAELPCNCKVDHLLACFPGPTECKEKSCEEDGLGCGWLLLQPCTGLCRL